MQREREGLRKEINKWKWKKGSACLFVTYVFVPSQLIYSIIKLGKFL